jgi:hypothetical protein
MQNSGLIQFFEFQVELMYLRLCVTVDQCFEILLNKEIDRSLDHFEEMEVIPHQVEQRGD